MTEKLMHSLSTRQLRKTEITIAYVLRYGVIAIVITLASSLIISWLNTEQSQKVSAQTLSDLVSGKMVPSLAPPMNLSAMLTQLHSYDPNAIAALGLISLILLPILRVALTVLLFLFEKDYVYFLITSFVLAVLLSSLIFGKSL